MCSSSFPSLILDYFLLSGDSWLGSKRCGGTAAGREEEEDHEGRPARAALQAACGSPVAAKGPVKAGRAGSAGQPPARAVHRPVLRLCSATGPDQEQKMNRFFFIDLKGGLLGAGLRLAFLFGTLLPDQPQGPSLAAGDVPSTHPATLRLRLHPQAVRALTHAMKPRAGVPELRWHHWGLVAAAHK